MKTSNEPWQHALTAAEFNELSTLAFHAANRLLTSEERIRHDELRRREERRG